MILTEEGKISLSIQGIDRRILELNEKYVHEEDLNERIRLKRQIKDYQNEKSHLQLALKNGKLKK